LNYFEKNIDLYLKQLKELHNYYPDIRDQIESDNLVLRGKVQFNEDFGTDFWINDYYLIEIEIPYDYPDALPIVKEIGGKIENTYPHFLKRGERALCLGTPTDLWFRFEKNKTLLHFVHYLLIPALYAHAYWKKKNIMSPWGENRHGSLGLADFFADYFQIYDLFHIIQFLDILLYDYFDWTSQCLCGSRKSLNECHGIQLKKLRKVPQNYLLYEVYNMTNDYFKIYQEPLGKNRFKK
jgi:hypothetical protein